MSDFENKTFDNEPQNTDNTENADNLNNCEKLPQKDADVDNKSEQTPFDVFGNSAVKDDEQNGKVEPNEAKAEVQPNAQESQPQQPYSPYSQPQPTGYTAYNQQRPVQPVPPVPPVGTQTSPFAANPNNTRSYTPPTYQPQQPQQPQQPNVPPVNNAPFNAASQPNAPFGYNQPQQPRPNAPYQPYQPVMQQQKQNPFDASPKKRNSKKGLKIFCVILAITVLLGVGIGVGYIAGGNNDLKSNNTQNDLASGDKSVVIQQGTVPQKDGVKPDSNGKYTADQVATLVSDSVVNITVYSNSSSSSAIASGVIIDKNGYILSNDHIYSEIPNAKFVITLNNGKSYNATYVAGDSRSDLSVLKMSGASNLTVATFADSSKISSGDDVIAIGSPYGLSGTVTKGIVSSPSRRISFSSTVNGSKANYSMRVIQTDTAINSGNSGGALVNLYGQVIGISSSKIVADGYEDLCFAIPSNDAIKTAKSLIANKKVVGRAKLGITYNEITAASALVNNIPSGLMVQTIDIDSNLYSSGISKGDIITEINGTKITSADAALDVIDDLTAGDKATLKVYIASSKKYKTVTAAMLEDKSVSSYSTQEAASTTQPYTFWK